MAEARARGVDVTCETCAHYLVFTDEDVEALGSRPQMCTALEVQRASGRSCGIGYSPAT